ncbi:MAG: MBL fold metallo-hydrolase [Nitrospinota bacterium]|nr:MBL fold metallo-hydrolase [Nitrospinota bacterium]
MIPPGEHSGAPGPDAERITRLAFGDLRRIMLFGQPGSGKSTLATTMASIISSQGETYILAADPGSPPFGPPGAINLGRWRDGAWELLHAEALCSLDAARFRLPLVAAVTAMAAKAPKEAFLIIDTPGVTRGMAAAELLEGIARGAKAEAVVILSYDESSPALASELRGLDVKIIPVGQTLGAGSPSSRERDIARTRLWNYHMDGAEIMDIDTRSVPLVGAPPPLEAEEAWRGRQAALVDSHGATVSMGEIISIGKDGVIAARMPPAGKEWRSLLVRDAYRDSRGYIRTSRPVAGRAWGRAAPDMYPDSEKAMSHGPAYATCVGQASVVLLNGVFGDPLLHLRLRDQRRSLLFDLGEATRLPGRIAHQVTDVFISHAHIDHIGGFLWLLRSRIGILSPCRVYGPAGLCANIKGMVDGILWDRIGLSGPVFEVAELSGEVMTICRVQAGVAVVEPLGERRITDGVILEEDLFAIRASGLDHKTPVIAYSFEQPETLNIRKEKLLELSLPPGKWLGELKIGMMRGEMDAMITPPGAKARRVAELADELVLRAPGCKMVYATDLGDTPQNRERLIRLAGGADLLFLEAVFTRRDLAQAEATKHLTATACGQIAQAAGVRRLAPFHFSRRYESTPDLVVAEVREEFPAIMAGPDQR